MEINLNKTLENDKEILEMILQFFYENKYLESAKLLEAKANIIYDQNEILQLKYLLKNHLFDESINFLQNSKFENFHKAETLKILKSRKYLELVKSEKTQDALEYLRTNITPLINDPNILNKFSTLLFHKEKDNLEKLLKQNFNEIYYDEFLIKKVQSMLCLSLDLNGNRILPNSRLETLLNNFIEISSVDVEMSDCTSDNDSSEKQAERRLELPLLSMKKNKKINLKFKENFIIEKHDDEIWHMDMGNSLKLLATCSRNGMIAIFKINLNLNRSVEENLSEIKIDCINYFSAHKKYITSMQWSKNEKYILTSSTDKLIKQWDAFDGKCLKSFQVHSDIVTSIRWLNDETFVSGGIDKKMIICTTGNRVLVSELFSRIRKVLFSEALNFLIIIPASVNDIILYDHRYYTEIHRITELDPVISSNLSIHDEGRYLITNISKVNASINLYDLTNYSLVNKFYGHSQQQYTIECSFGGALDEYIISGSEDASIYIWHRNNSIPISIIKGHTGSVNNCLLSFYNNTPFLISVSDDHTLRIWGHNVKIIYEDTFELKKSKKSKNSNSIHYDFYNFIDQNESLSNDNSPSEAADFEESE